jgi:DNA-binding transcriptional LysR family regulator
MNYTLHQLRIFREVARTGSVTKAAEALHLSQPAISIQLNKLEEQFELPLLEPAGRGVRLTDFGQRFVEGVERLIQESDSLAELEAAHRKLLTGKLRVAVVSTGKYVMPYLLAGFLRRHPGIELRMEVTNRSAVVTQLEDGAVDFALVSILPEHLPLQSLAILNNELYLVRSPGLLRLPEVDDPLLDVPFIFREMGSGTRYMTEQFLKARSLKPPRRMELTSNEAVKQAVVAGLGQSIMPIIGLKNELKAGLLEVVEYPGLPMVSQWQLVWRADRKAGAAAKGFEQWLKGGGLAESLPLLQP